MSNPDVSYEKICDYIDEDDSAFDPKTKVGQLFARNSGILTKKKESKEPEKEKIVIVREVNSITKQMKVNTHAGDQSLPIITYMQTMVYSAIFPSERATTICTNFAMFQLRQGIVVLIESKTDELINTEGGSQEFVTTEQVDPIN